MFTPYIQKEIISPFPHLHTPFSPTSLVVSVDIKHHVYLLPFNGQVVTAIQTLDFSAEIT